MKFHGISFVLFITPSTIKTLPSLRTIGWCCLTHYEGCAIIISLKGTLFYDLHLSFIIFFLTDCLGESWYPVLPPRNHRAESVPIVSSDFRHKSSTVGESPVAGKKIILSSVSGTGHLAACGGKVLTEIPKRSWVG